MMEQAEREITNFGYRHLFESDITWYVENGEAKPQIAESDQETPSFIQELNHLNKVKQE